jgi:very-short-patch-repair endonuclease
MDELLLSGMMRQNMSGFQKKVWKLIGGKMNPWGFFPEYPVGEYIIDFFSEEHRVGIEADGPHHAFPARKAADLIREEALLKQGIALIHINPAMLVRLSAKDIVEYIDRFIRAIKDEETLPKPKAKPPEAH